MNKQRLIEQTKKVEQVLIRRENDSWMKKLQTMQYTHTNVWKEIKFRRSTITFQIKILIVDNIEITGKKDKSNILATTFALNYMKATNLSNHEAKCFQIT